MQLGVDSDTKPANSKHMENINPYEAGKNDMREQIIAFIYERYLYNKTFFGKEHHATQEIRRIIEDIREDQAIELEKLNQTETASE
jgi:hypothetical protein